MYLTAKAGVHMHFIACSCSSVSIMAMNNAVLCHAIDDV